MNIVAYIVAIVLFVLAAFGVTVGGASEQDVVAVGLGFFALGHILPR